MTYSRVDWLDELGCVALEEELVELIYKHNSLATGYFDGKPFGGGIRTDTGQLVGGISGHTWGNVCVVTHLWVAEQHRGQGVGAGLLRDAEQQARQRSCTQAILTTHSFQAPAFYEGFGYARACTIDDWPRGHSNVIYRKLL